MQPRLLMLVIKMPVFFNTFVFANSIFFAAEFGHHSWLVASQNVFTLLRQHVSYVRQLVQARAAAASDQDAGVLQYLCVRQLHLLCGRVRPPLLLLLAHRLPRLGPHQLVGEYLGLLPRLRSSTSTLETSPPPRLNVDTCSVGERDHVRTRLPDIIVVQLYCHQSVQTVACAHMHVE